MTSIIADTFYTNNEPAHHKPSKPRVLPILKKFSSNATKKSLDLDRSWDEQNLPGQNDFSHIWNRNCTWADEPRVLGLTSSTSTRAGPGGVTSKGPSFSGFSGSGAALSGTRLNSMPLPFSPTELRARPMRDGPFGFPAEATIKGSHHVRSTSGASHTSHHSHHSHMSVNASTSGARAGSFVHPFQLTPHMATPPLSYSGSVASLEKAQCDSTANHQENASRESSEYDTIEPLVSPPMLSSRAQGGARRPSIISRTSSISDAPTSLAPTMPSATVGTSYTRTSSDSRLALGLTSSRSDLHLNTLLAAGPPNKSLLSHCYIDLPPTPPMMVSPVSSHTTSALLPFRSSLDMSSFTRKRASSDISSTAQLDQVRHERRKFDEKELRKQQIWDEKMIKKRERELNREAAKIQADARKSSLQNQLSRSTPSPEPQMTEASNPKSGVNLRTRFSRLRRTSKSNDTQSQPQSQSQSLSQPRARESYGDLTNPNSPPNVSDMEKMSSFPCLDCHHDACQNLPTMPISEEDLQSLNYRSHGRAKSAKARTLGTWTLFILWLRTKIFRLTKRD